MHRALAQLGGRIDALFYCPHSADDNCTCRKPKPGMMEEIGKRFGQDLKGVAIVGDALRDLQAGAVLGMQPILVRTGKGEETNSEGVYGLRKAFSDAGAQNIIMSLWKVDDKVTQEFMSRFYEIWLNDKTTIRQAFNRTQLEIKAKYPEPYYWGAFILIGD
jgi:histidinol phosphatase-like enzyme